MTEEKLLTVREVAILLGISEKEVLDLAEDGIIPAYKVGGVYLRFKKEQVHEYWKSHGPAEHKYQSAQKYSLNDRLRDFFYFNDFYILATAAILIILIIIFKGY